jgi:hypothetical protein
LAAECATRKKTNHAGGIAKVQGKRARRPFGGITNFLQRLILPVSNYLTELYEILQEWAATICK